LTPSGRLVLQYILETAVDNAKVHGGANDVRVGLSYSHGEWKVSIANDGPFLKHRNPQAYDGLHALDALEHLLRENRGGLDLHNSQSGVELIGWWKE
jgi:signal transduction histidine kinase